MLESMLNICIANEKVILCCAVMVILDTLLGITKAIKNDEFTFTSTGLRKCIPKIIEYISIIIFGIAIEFTFDIKCVIIFCVLLIITEAISIKENLTSIPIIQNLFDKIISTLSSNYGIDEDVIGDKEEPEQIEFEDVNKY